MPNVPEVPVEPRSIEQGIEPETPPSGNHEVSIFPNPAREQVTFQLEGSDYTEKTFLMLDNLGRVIRTAIFSGDVYYLNRGNLNAGTYPYVILGDGIRIHSGTIILH